MTTTTAAPVFLEVTLAATADVEAREVSGLGVPFGEEMERMHWQTGAPRQRIDGATVREGAQLFYGHYHLAMRMPIGLVTSAEATPEGVRVTARISKTAKGDEVYTLLRDGVLSKFSIGYLEDVWHVEENGDLVVHDDIDVFELSVVPRPQYDTATVDTVLHQHQPTRTAPREAEPHMTETLTAPAEDITALSEAVDRIERQVATLSVPEAGGGTRDSGYLTYGDFLKGVARGDTEALEFLAFVGAVTGDLGGHISDAWVGDLLRELEAKRRVVSFFGTSPLPDQGMGVEYGKVKPTSDTTQVAKQAAEGDTLAYGKVAFGTDRAPLETYGGWTDWARQVVERAGSAVVEKFFRALYRKYMQTTEAAVRTTAMATANAVEVGTAAHDLATPDGWVDYAVDAVTFLDDRGLTLDGFLVASDVFKTLGKMRVGAGGDYFLDRDTGALNLKGLSADVFNVPVILVPSATAGAVRGASEEAIDVWEDGSAPFRLQDDDITNLTQAMSIYGYMAHAVTDSEGITRPNDGVA